MVTCRSCGSSFQGNFCTNCGAPAFPGNPLRCPRCNNEAAPNTAFCAYCGTALSSAQAIGQGFVPSQPAPAQQNNASKYLLGALGGAAAVIGGEILMHDVEKGIERREWENAAPYHHHHHHHHHRRCECGHEFGVELDFCPRCRRRWRGW